MLVAKEYINEPEYAELKKQLDEIGFKFKTNPFEHQIELFNTHKDDEIIALLLDMGLGKTKISIDLGAYKYLTGQINAMLVVAPNGVHEQWHDEEFKKHCPIFYRPFLYKSGKMGARFRQTQFESFVYDNKPGLPVMFVNVEAFQSEGVIQYVAQFVKHYNPFIVIDESTRIKRPTAKRSKTIHRLSKYGHRIILTGTPAAKSPYDLWSQYEFLKNNFFGCNYFIYQHRYGITMKAVNHDTGQKYTTLIDEKTFAIIKNKLRLYGEMRGGDLMPDDYEEIAIITGVSEKNIKFIKTQEEFTRFKRMDELKSIMAPITSSYKKEDCLDLPPKIYEVIKLDMPKEIRKVYNDLKNEMLATYADEELTVVHKMTLYMRLRQVCGGFFPYDADIEDDELEKIKAKKRKQAIIPIGAFEKNPKMVRIKEELEEIKLPIIIWASFTAELLAINEALKKDYSVGLYHGATAQLARRKMIDDFKNGRLDILLGNKRVGAMGLNLQNADYMSFYSDDFDTEGRLQAEDRIHRIGAVATKFYKDYLYKNSVDEKVYRINKEGKSINEFFRDSSIYDILKDEELADD